MTKRTESIDLIAIAILALVLGLAQREKPREFSFAQELRGAHERIIRIQPAVSEETCRASWFWQRQPR
jgi:hypothetical protein